MGNVSNELLGFFLEEATEHLSTLERGLLRLEKDPGERTQSIKQISVNLKRYKRGSSRPRASRITSTAPAAGRVRAYGVSWPGVPWVGIAGYVLAAITGIALVLVLWGLPSRQSGVSVPVVRTKIDLPEDAPVVWNGYMVLSVSPAGGSMVYQTGDGQCQDDINILTRWDKRLISAVFRIRLPTGQETKTAEVFRRKLLAA